MVNGKDKMGPAAATQHLEQRHPLLQRSTAALLAAILARNGLGAGYKGEFCVDQTDERPCRGKEPHRAGHLHISPMTGILIWVGTALVGALLGLFLRPRTIAIFCASAFAVAVAGVVIGYGTGKEAVGFMSGVATMAILVLGALLVGGAALLRALRKRIQRRPLHQGSSD